ncbi:uncharacterized protein CIMG_08917 [Coccidioides immitis RS]|uniref:Zn(2)-C6 fungal-type domain-containing protein n=1 Tax=Coccidioides immitis (strain RS) TaxID=246410 RepID=J3K6H3_COCIM|nr:uncharacterized protein CIMG_08917 [Coccidioides immitis RS]EAS30171.3 hypothetical protein CIMG_08917 [Coccidioides immitis RS]
MCLVEPSPTISNSAVTHKSGLYNTSVGAAFPRRPAGSREWKRLAVTENLPRRNSEPNINYSELIERSQCHISMEATPSRPKRRSRSGCTECRQRHRKCDERKPTCSGCLRSGRQCVYTLRLTWGGRPFSKSRFGECLRNDPGLVQVPFNPTSGDKGAFVYGSGKPSKPASVPQQLSSDSSYTGDTINFDRTEAECSLSAAVFPLRPQRVNQAPNSVIPRNPYELQWIPPAYRFLLDHFMSCTTLSLSCHPMIQRTYCSVLIPMALQTSHLFVALLSLAATHRICLGMDQSITQLDWLKFTSLRQLQAALAQPRKELNHAVIATTLTLCTADIVSDGRSPGSWRSHLHGTAAIIAEHLQNARNSGSSLSEATLLLWRWYLSIETITLLSGNLVISPGSRTVLQLRRLIGNDEIDDLTGFSTALIPIFGDINLLAVESGLSGEQQCPTGTDDISSIPNDIIRERCFRMIENISSMLASHEPRFRPTIDASLSSLHRIDFAAVDETYHHVALLHLYRRVLNLPSSSTLVQKSVQQIIHRVSAIHFLHEPCPGVAVLQPLFAAGCEACDAADRDDVRTLLSRIESQYGMGNVRSARAFLEDLWIMRDESGDFEGRMRWDKVMVEKGLDILPY